MWTIWTFGGLSAAASFVNLVSKPLSIITWPRAIALTAAILTAWASFELWVRRRGTRWTLAGNAVVVRRVGPRYRFATLGIVILLWLPIAIGGRSPAPAAPVEIGSAYHSDLPRLLFDRPSIGMIDLPFHSVLTLRNIGQTTLVNVSVGVHKAVLAGPVIEFLHPLAPLDRRPGFYAGWDRGVLPAIGEQRPYLLPGETLSVDLAQYLDRAERALLVSKIGDDIGPITARDLATIDLGAIAPSQQARRLSVSLPRMGAAPDEYFGVLFWIAVSYENRDRTDRLIFFGGLLRGRSRATATAPAVPSIGIVDFVAQLPYAYVDVHDPDGSSSEREVAAPVNTNVTRDDPATIPGFAVEATTDKRQWIAGFWAKDPGGEIGGAPAHSCPPSKDDKDGWPDWELPLRERASNVPGTTLSYRASGADFTGGGTHEYTFKMLFDGSIPTVTALLDVVDASGRKATFSMALPRCEARFAKLTKEVLASRGIDATRIVRVRVAPRDNTEGYLYGWGFKPRSGVPAGTTATAGPAGTLAGGRPAQ